MTTNIRRSDKLIFKDYNCFEKIYSDKKVFCSLIDCYLEVFNEPGPWHESYSFLDIFYTLKTQLSGDAALRVAIEKDTGVVIAFCWAQLLQPNQVFRTVNSIQYFRKCSNSEPELECAIKELVDDSPVIYLQDLGVKNGYRGKVYLGYLIAPVLESVATQSNTRDIFFWSIAQTCVKKLASKADIKMKFEYNNLQFFSGQLPSLSHYVK